MLAFGGILIWIAYKHRHNHPYSWSSSIGSGLLSIITGFLVYLYKLVPYPYIGFLQWWTAAWVFITIVYVDRVRGREDDEKSRDGDNGSLEQGHDEIKEEMDGLEEKHEWARKAFHLAGFLAVFAYFLVGPLVAPLVDQAITFAGPSYTTLWGSFSDVYEFQGPEEAGRYLTMFALLATVLLVAIVDATRIFLGEQYSLVNVIEKRAGRILREKEKGAPGPQVFIALSSAFAWSFAMVLRASIPNAMNIALSGIMIATLADGAAAIIGKKFGKHKIERSHQQVKSVEGFIAGTLVAFIIALFFVSWILALISATIFFIIDYASPPIADNVINPVAITIAILVLSTWM